MLIVVLNSFRVQSNPNFLSSSLFVATHSPLNPEFSIPRDAPSFHFGPRTKEKERLKLLQLMVVTITVKVYTQKLHACVAGFA